MRNTRPDESDWKDIIKEFLAVLVFFFAVFIAVGGLSLWIPGQ